MKHHELMRRASLNALGLAILYSVMGIVSFRINILGGLVGLFVSVLFFRDYQLMGNASKELREASEKVNQKPE